MPTPTHCSICRTVLDTMSESGLCATCLRATTPLHGSSVLALDDAAVTRTLADRHDPAADTRTGSQPMDPALASYRVPPGYIPLALIGQGGMGLVYQVWETGADRVVALKLIRAATGPEMRARFGIEVRALAGLEHPNIVRVLTVNLTAPDPYFTMEFVTGHGLDRRIRERGPIPAREAARLAETVARAVHAANEAGVIHRDLKPSNVLIGTDGVPKVTDFGVAKREGLDDDLTVTGVVVGTPAYMSPEQASGKKVSRAADVYGLGALLYALLTGHAPFQGQEQADILVKVRNEDPPLPRSLRPDVPAALEGIVLKCLAKDAATRYPTAAALADDLARWLAGERPHGRQPAWWLRTWRMAIRSKLLPRVLGGAVLLAAAIALGLYGGSLFEGSGGPRPQPVPSRREVLPPSPAPRVFPEQFQPVLSHDDVRTELLAGRKVALVGENGPRVPIGWGLGACDIVPSPANDIRFSLLSSATTILQLLPDAGLNRYRLRAEIRQDSKRPNPGATGRSDLSRAGLIVGHARGDLGQNATAHAALAVGFAEPDAGAQPAPDSLTSMDLYVLDLPLETPIKSHHAVGAMALAAAMTPGPTWRTIEVDVEPTGITFRHDGRTLTRTTTDIQRSWARSDDEVRARRPGLTTVPLPEWSPRLPVGLWVNQSWASFRHVTIEPLAP